MTLITHIIMAKEPVPGRVNTRLTVPGGLSPDDAARLAEAMLVCVIRRLDDRGPVVVAVSPDAAVERLRDRMAELLSGLDITGMTWLPQGAGDLGDRIVRIWRTIGAGPALVFGVDTTDMPASAMDEAASVVMAGASVIGPTDDGGYWTIGGPACRPELFHDIDWGSSSVYDDTLDHARSAGITLRSITPWMDVDHPSDLRALGRRLHADDLDLTNPDNDTSALLALRRVLDACLDRMAENDDPGAVTMNDTTTEDAAVAMDARDIDLSESLILLVDDNLQNLELMQAYLEALPCRIETATDGAEAVEAIDRECPDLVLLDVMMPRMSGFEVCQKIRASPGTRDTKVIMVTALHEVGDFERAVECGTDDFITKPVNKLELITRVRSQLEHRLLTRQYQQLLALKGRTGLGESARPEAGSKLDDEST